MPKLNQKGVIHLLVPMLLIGGIIVTVYLVTAGPLKLFPKAASSSPIPGPMAGFLLNSAKSNYAVGEQFEVQLYARSDYEASNLFVAKINYPKEYLEIAAVQGGPNSFITSWVDLSVDKEKGQISIVGAVPNPGYKTSGGAGSLMATIYVRGKVASNSSLSFDLGETAVYRNSDNKNILNTTQPFKVIIGTDTTPGPIIKLSANPTEIKSGGTTTISWSIAGNIASCSLSLVSSTNVSASGGGVVPTPFQSGSKSFTLHNPTNSTITYTGSLICQDENGKSGQASVSVRVLPAQASPTPSPSSSPNPGGSGDGNGDGKINLIDLSVLLTDFNKNGGIRTSIDMNGDGKINTFDFSLLRNLLIKYGVIKG